MRHFTVGEGRVYHLDKLTLAFKHDGDRDPCGYTVCRAKYEAGWPGARLHRHGYEEWHIQLEGSIEGQLGDDAVHLSPGDMTWIPGGFVHGFKPAPTAGAQLLISAPPGLFEGFVSGAVALQAGDATRTLDAIAMQHGIEFLTPSRS